MDMVFFSWLKDKQRDRQMGEDRDTQKEKEHHVGSNID